jgi:hypothetical protein
MESPAESTITVLAALLALFAALLDPLVTVGAAFVFLVALVLFKVAAKRKTQ